MRYTNVFCGRYTLETGTRVIAWFNIVLYVINIVFNILAVDIVKSYKENVDDDIDYNREQLLIFHYICLIFGVVTVLSSAIFLIKMSESKDFMQFMVKWNVVRCLFAFVAIIYACAEMEHILTVVISSLLLVIDLCASIYFTGVMFSYIKQMENPSGQIYSSHENREPSVYLVSRKTTSQTENKVDDVNEVSTFPSQLPEKKNTSIQRETTGTVSTAVDVETRKDATEEMNLNSTPATNDNITRTINIVETENSSSSSTNDKGGDKGNDHTTMPPSLEKIATAENTSTKTETNGKSDPNNTHQKDNELEEKKTSTDSETTNPDNNEPHSDSDNDTRVKTHNKKSLTDINLTEETDVPADAEIQVESEKREIQKPENEVDSDSDRSPTEDSEKSSEAKGIENPAVDVSEIEPPSVVIIPSRPDMA